MWTALAEVVIVLAVIAVALWGGVKYGETRQRKKDAEGRAEDMARNAGVAAQPDISRPLGGMRPR